MTPAKHPAPRLALLLSLVGLAVAAAGAQVTDKDLLSPDPNDFLLYSGTYDSQRHSLLKEINTEQRRDAAGKVDLSPDRREGSRGAAHCLQRRDVRRPVQPRARARRGDRPAHLGAHASAGERRMAARHRHLRRHGLHGRAGFRAGGARPPHRQSDVGSASVAAGQALSGTRCRLPPKA